MNRVSITILSILLLCSSNATAQYATERADQLLERVNNGGILEVVEADDLTELDAQILSLIMNFDLDGVEEAKEVLEQRIQFEFGETGFELAGKQQLRNNAIYQTEAAMNMIQAARAYKGEKARPIIFPGGTVQYPLEPKVMPLVMPYTPIKTPHFNLARIMEGLNYALWVVNGTSLVIQEAVAFYQQYGNPHVYRAQHLGLLPDVVAVLQLGNCFFMQHYSLGVFIDDQLVARVPPDGHNMTPAMASVWHPWDREPCIDTWEFGTAE